MIVMKPNGMNRALLMGLLLALSACSSPRRPQVRTIDEIEKEQQRPVSGATTVNEMAGVFNQAANEVKIGCMKSFAHARFCDCLDKNMPLAGDFASYVRATAFTKEQINYEQMSFDERDIVDRSRRVREQCVGELR